MLEGLQSADIDTLRRLAIDAWQRAEKLELERAKAVEAKTKAVREKKVVQAKLDAVLSENEVGPPLTHRRTHPRDRQGQRPRHTALP